MAQSNRCKQITALVCHTTVFRAHNDLTERRLGRFVSGKATIQTIPSKPETMLEAEQAARRASRRMSVLLGCK